MKYKNLFILAASALFILPAVGSAQVIVHQRAFSIDGIVNPGDDDLANQISANIDIKFVDNDNNGSIDDLLVNVENSGPAESAITAFYIYRPVSDATEPFSLDADPEWELQQSVATSHAGDPVDIASEDRGKYFGATSADSSYRLTYPDPPSSRLFQFSFDSFDMDLSAFNAWLDNADSLPLVVVRWQAIYIDEGLNDESGRGGSGGGRGFDPRIPEPSQVAALAVLGLGGILYTRRRLTKKN